MIGRCAAVRRRDVGRTQKIDLSLDLAMSIDCGQDDDQFCEWTSSWNKVLFIRYVPVERTG